MVIPQSDILTTNRLGKIFSNTVMTYKFFCFVLIMQIHTNTDNPRISLWDIVIRMVVNAWYPIYYFRLPFDRSDSLFDIVMELQHITQIPIDANSQTIINGLQSWLNVPAIPNKQIHPKVRNSQTKKFNYWDTATCVAFYDGKPVLSDHALIIPKCLVVSYIDLTNHECEASQYVKQKVDERFNPDGYNVGININKAASQSVFRGHMHLIPRYKDAPNPKGGVKDVFPTKQKY